MSTPRLDRSSAPTNLTYSTRQANSYLESRSAAAPIRNIVIVGGGSAGWMAATILANALIRKGVEITVLESPTVGIIGVGEGSTPWLRGFFDSLGIEEAEWMPECNATYKCGITFDRRSTRPGFESYCSASTCIGTQWSAATSRLSPPATARPSPRTSSSIAADSRAC